MNTLVERFQSHRARLLGFSYRMLGSRTDAEDILQEAWLKWFQTREEIQNDRAFLTTFVSRLCLDRLRGERVRRDAYRGPWLPEPIAGGVTPSAEAVTELADDLSFALMLTLQRLSARERVAFLLHDVFGVPFVEVAGILEASEEAARQLATRARKAVRDARPSPPPSREVHERLLNAFMPALNDGDESELRGLLREDAMYMNDSGGFRPAASRVVRGADRIVRLLLGLRRRYGVPAGDVTASSELINGHKALLVYVGGILLQIWTISVHSDRIAEIYVVSNPEKLANLSREAINDVLV